MINIRFGKSRDTITQINVYFDLNYEPEWITHPLVKNIIKDIDKSEVINEGVIQSPILGPIPPERLSGGTKLLILLIFMPNNEYYGTKFGNNCIPWVIEISKKHDINLAVNNLLKFPIDRNDLNIKITNNGKIINTAFDYFLESTDFLSGGEENGD